MISNNNRWISISFVLVLFLAIVTIIASFGLRGCDQYWYVADVESLMNNKYITNYLYSGLVLQDKSYLDNPRFIHNILSLYLVLPFAYLFGSYVGWIFMNIVMSLLSGLLIYWSIIKRTNDFFYALLGLVFFLLNPVTVWQASQPMAEVSVTPFIASVIAISTTGKLDLKFAAAIIVLLGLANMVREIFIPSFVIFLFIYFVSSLKKKPLSHSVRDMMILVFLELAMLKLKDILFGVSIFRVKDMAAKALFDNKSTDFVFNGNINLPQIKLLNSNLMDNFIYQFWTGDSIFLLYIIFNVLMFMIFYNIKKHDQHLRQIVYISIMLLVNYFMFVMLHQNQFRYMLIPYPAILICAILVIEKYFVLSQIVLRRIIYIYCFISLTLLTPMIIRAKKTADSDRLLRERIAEIISVVDKDDSVLMCLASGQYNISYAARPRKMIFAEIKSRKDYLEKVIGLVRPEWVLFDVRVIDKIESDKNKWIIKPVKEIEYNENKHILASLIYR